MSFLWFTSSFLRDHTTRVFTDRISSGVSVKCRLTSRFRSFFCSTFFCRRQTHLSVFRSKATLSRGWMQNADYEWHTQRTRFHQCRRYTGWLEYWGVECLDILGIRMEYDVLWKIALFKCQSKHSSILYILYPTESGMQIPSKARGFKVNFVATGLRSALTVQLYWFVMWVT